MKVEVYDVNYKGHHFKKVEFETPQMNNDDEIDEFVTKYLIEHLDQLLENESN